MPVKVKNVCKSFGEKKVLTDLSVSFCEGVNIVTGPSGCGKTTLLRIIAGLEKADSGEVIFDGVLHGAPVAFVFFEPRLFPGCTVLENAAAASPDGKKQGRAMAAEYLASLGMADALKLYPRELSAGMAQRVQLVRALVSLSDERKTLILDEPFRGLDPDTKEKAAALILSKTEGKTVICVTHEKDDIPLLKAISAFSFDSNTTV